MKIKRFKIEGPIITVEVKVCRDDIRKLGSKERAQWVADRMERDIILRLVEETAKQCRAEIENIIKEG